MYNKRKRKYSVGGSTLSGAASGAALGASVGGPWGGVIGGIVGGVAGLISGSSEEKKRKRAQGIQQFGLQQQNYLNDLYSLQAYNNQFNSQNMAEGGTIQLPGGEGNMIASDIMEMNGNTHRDGGIDLYDNVEVEDNEIIKQDRVYSDRLKVRKGFLEYLKEEGVSINKNSYAEVALSLGKMKERYEEKIQSNDPYSYNTGMIMLQRIEEYLNELFFDQEMNKLIRKNEKEKILLS